MSFTESDIEPYFSAYLSQSLSFEKEVYFGQMDFDTPQSEESIACLLGKKSVFESPLLFWIKAFQKILVWQERLEEWQTFTPDMFVAQKEKIRKERFAQAKNEMFNNLPASPELLSPPYKSYQLLDVWNERIYLLENEDKYQLVYWDTSA